MDLTWIKLSTSLFNNRKIRQIERMTDGDSIIVIWLKLLVLAGELNDGGEIYLKKGLPFTEESLALQVDRPREVVALALRTFEAYGMIEIREKCIFITNWEKYQSVDKMAELREYNRQAKKRERDRKRNVNDSQFDMSMTSQPREEKRREEKNREDILRDNFRQLAKQWQSNVDADEANKEIRTQ